MTGARVSRDGEWGAGQVLVGKYRLLERVGAGGMGSVYAARRLSLGDVVAVKGILPERISPRNRARFLREARALARIRHPNVVRVFDFGEAEDGRPYMVTEFIDGPTLAQVLAAGQLPLTRGLELFTDICRAVEAGHRRGVVHRDLKPGNVMLERSDDGGETVKVLDFGLARLADEDDAGRSHAGTMIGTCAYMSPESIEHGSAGPAGDLFSLGVMLYEMATGRLPFSGQNAVATIMRICDGEYPSPATLVAELPDPVLAAIDAALSHEPEGRPETAMELAALAHGRQLPRPQVTGSFVSLDFASRDAGWETGQPPSSGQTVADTPDSDSGRRLSSALAAGQVVDPLATEEVPAAEMAASSPALAEGATQAVDGETRRLHAAIASPAFVGRRFELEALLELQAASAVREEIPIAVVFGDPGMGRSRLLQRFAELARERGAAVFEGRFWGYEGERAAAGETFVRMLGPGFEGAAAAADGDRRCGFAALARGLEQHAGGRSVVLVLDDLQQAPSRDLEFLTYLVRGGQRATPVVVVASARRAEARSDAHTELSRWLLQLAGLKARTTLTLAALDDDEVRSWLDAAFGRLRIHPRDLRRLARASGGNPYVLSELVRHLVASAHIRRGEPGPDALAIQSPGWVCGRLAPALLPEGVASAVADRLVGLAAPLREMLETAAVLGEQFGFDDLAAARAVDEEQLEALVDEAVAQGLLAEVELEAGADLSSDLAFASRTVQRVLYGGLGGRRRRRLHRRVVAALRRGEVEPRRLAKPLARHYRAIGDWSQTLEWGLVAAGDALGRHDYDAAELALEQVEVALAASSRDGRTPDTAVRLRVDALSGALDARVGRYAEGVSKLEEARSLLACSDAADPGPSVGAAFDEPLEQLRFSVAVALARCHLGLGELERAVEVGREALQLAQQLDPAVVGGPLRRFAAKWDARIELAHSLGRLGRWSEAMEVLRPVVEAEAAPVLRGLHVRALREFGWLEARSGNLAAAQQRAREAEAEARLCGEPIAEYCAVSLAGVVASARGDHRAALPHFREALRRARALSLRRREMIELANLGMSLAEAGDRDEALSSMLGVLAICRELGDIASAADARVGLGRILVRQGNFAEAAASLRRGHELCEAVGRREYAAIALLELGRCELDRGYLSSAQEVLLVAHERLRELGSLHLWEVELTLARAARNGGDEDEALRRAGAAAELIETHRRSVGTQVAFERGLALIQAFIDGSA